MVVAHLIVGLVTGIGAVLIGLVAGHDGWIMLALYMTGGLLGMASSASYMLLQPDGDWR